MRLPEPSLVALATPTPSQVIMLEHPAHAIVVWVAWAAMFARTSPVVEAEPDATLVRTVGGVC